MKKSISSDYYNNGTFLIKFCKLLKNQINCCKYFYTYALCVGDWLVRSKFN